MVKYCYSVTIDGCKCECNSAKAVVELINKRAHCPAVTVDMINTLMTRPAKANKRLFRTTPDENMSKIYVERKQLPTKGQKAQAEINKVNAIVQQMKSSA